MPIEPPDPGRIARALSDQLALLRALVDAYPDRPEYAAALDLTERAIEQLKSGAPAQAQR
jgi:hypothetical protein